MARESRQAGNLAAREISNNQTHSKAFIGHTVETQLDTILWQLIQGDVELHELTPALAGFWHLAHESGRQSRQPRIDRLNYLADLWYFCYANRKTPADFYRHETNELWEEATR